MHSVGRCGVIRLQMKFGHVDGMRCFIDSTSILVKIKSVSLYIIVGLCRIPREYEVVPCMGHLTVALLQSSPITIIISVTSLYTKVCDLQWLSRCCSNVVGGLRNRSSNSGKGKRIVCYRKQ